ncbi:MAG: hypothetical protein LBD35_05525 [Prevotellaceae bacterium]|jgi:hypothetical protein|nr:hypothetical protein [Prevotellaceae bacterium]
MSKSKKNKTTRVSLSPENFIRKKSRSLPIYKCLINKNWKEHGLPNIFVVRRHASGNVTFCVYMVDVFCLGVKDTIFTCNVPPENIDDRIAKGDFASKMEEISYELAHNIIFAALEYAEEYGFRPHRSFTSTTQYFLEEDNDNVPLIEIKCGTENGRPMYINNGCETPDQAEKIIRQLEKTAGKGNFGFILRTGTAESFDVDLDINLGDDAGSDADLRDYREIFAAIDKEDLEKEISCIFKEYLKHTDHDTCDDPELANTAMVLADFWLKENNVINLDISNEYMKMMRDDFSSVKIVEIGDVPNSLFPALTTGGKNLEFDFLNTFTAIYSPSLSGSDIDKQIKWFAEKYGTCEAAVYLMALFATNCNPGSMRATERLCSGLPDYFLVKLLRKDMEFVVSPPANRKDARKRIMAMVKGATLTQFEMMQFIICYVVCVFGIRNSKTPNLLEIASALSELMKSNTLNYSDFVTEMISIYAETRQVHAAIMEFFKRNPAN